MAQVLAAADIGSNTVHLLVARLDGLGRMQRLANDSEWLSLGEVVSLQGRIPRAQEDRLLAVLRRFVTTSRSFKSEALYVFATEAMRRAANHEEVMARVKRELEIYVDLIKPQREATLALAGAMIDCGGPGTLTLVEMGGGSVQVAAVADGQIERESSLPLGTGALVAECGLGQPATEVQLRRLTETVRSGVARLRDYPRSARMVASGGVARGLWRALHPDGDRRLHRRELEHVAWDTPRLTTAQICARYGVKEKRAGTLLPGALMYLAVLEAFGHDELTVSEFGVREGAILEMAGGKVPSWRA